MAWNTTDSILGTGHTSEDVAREADTIFTATFVGMVIDRGRHSYRVDMEPDMDGKDQQTRSRTDQSAMRRLNDICAKVNHIVRSYEPLQEEERGLHWGLTPEFSRGGMIAGGEAALKANGEYTKAFLEGAWNYLTRDKDGDAQSIYIGRGAYCGLVVDDSNDAITAMSTLRTVLGPYSNYPVNSGDRWLPPTESAVFKARKNALKNDDPGFTWGMIGGSALQEQLRTEGMKFVPPEVKPGPDPKKEIVGYTHGMIRAIYECNRIGGGRPYEMSLGVNTAKLASCMSCSLFMIANGYAPSASHLGKGESWLPLYHTHQHAFSYKPNKTAGESEEAALSQAIGECNDRWASKMRLWMWTGLQAMKAQPDWVDKGHMASLDALQKKLERLGHSPSDGAVCANLYLDAMSYHASDAARIDNTLSFGPNPRRDCEYFGENDDRHAAADWLVDSWRRHPWMTAEGRYTGWAEFKNPFTDEEIKRFRTLPHQL